MIIRFTMNDNDYTQLIELFLSKPLTYRVSEYIDDLKNDLNIKKIGEAKYYKDWKNLQIKIDEFKKLITKCSENKISGNERAEFLKILKESFLYFAGKIKNDYNYSYIKKRIKINLKRRISDEWQNYEVVYYFISNEKYITL